MLCHNGKSTKLKRRVHRFNLMFMHYNDDLHLTKMGHHQQREDYKNI